MNTILPENRFNVEYEPSICDAIVTILTITPLSLMFAFIAITQIDRLTFGYFSKQSTDTETDEPKETYTDKYPLDNVAESEDPERKVNPNSFIMDYTPDGIVIMRYNYDHESFIYWSNKKNIKYPILETLARKYVSAYCCKELYIDRDQIREEKRQVFEEKRRENEERERMEKEDKENKESGENDSSGSENSVFASFKSYNKKGAAKDNDVSSKKEFVNVCERSNSFLRKGLISEFEILQVNKYQVVEAKPKLDFETFKKMFMGNNEVISDDDTDVEKNINNNDQEVNEVEQSNQMDDEDKKTQ